MAFSSSDVPAVFDIWINGNGFMFDASYDDSVFRKAPAAYTYTPTFLERTNVSGAYGDNSQDFYLTVSQNDWSLGDGQRFFRADDRSKRYWQGFAVDPITVPGQVTMTRGVVTISPAADVVCACPIPGTPAGDAHAIITSTTLYFVAGDGTITSKGAHAAGTPLAWGACRDSARSPKVYIAGSTSIRLWNESGSAYSTFSATANAGSLAFLNNILYSCDGSTLNSYATDGTKTTIFTWKDAGGTALAVNTDAVRLVPYANRLLIFFPQLEGRPQLWMYDGSTSGAVPFQIADLPASIIGYDCLVLDGVVFLSGAIESANPFSPQTASASLAVIWAYSSGQLGEVWRAEVPSGTASAAAALTTNPALGSYGGRLVFFDASAGSLFNGTSTYAAIRQYDIESGAVTILGWVTKPTATDGNVQFTSKVKTILLSFNGAYTGADSAFIYPDSTALAGLGAQLVSSAFDFDNSLQKVFRSVRVDWEGGGSGGTVDIAYAVDQIVTSGAGSWTSLQSGAVSGTEYTLGAGVTGHEIQVRLTMNKPASGLPPTIKRLYVRAAPVLQSYRRNTYILDCSGNKSAPQPSYVQLVNGFPHDLDGVEMVTNLRTAIAAGVVSVTDRYGTFNAIIEPAASEFKEVRAAYGRAEYRVELTVREV